MPAARSVNRNQREAHAVTSEAQQQGADGQASSHQLRDGLVVLLSVTTGVADATSFLGLGKVFGSVMTGNMVLLGLGAATHDGAESLRAGLALAGYAAGVLVGAPVAARAGHRRIWPTAVTVTLALEACLLLAAGLTWDLTRRVGPASVAILLLLAAGMGLQSAAVRRLGQMSTTYLTSTFTGVIAGLSTRRKPEGLWRSIGVILAVIAGALCAGLLVKFAPGWVPVLQLAPLITVVGCAIMLSD